MSEIGLEMAHGSPTVEGLLDKIRQNIEEGNPFAVGDSDRGQSLLHAWLKLLDAHKNGEAPLTLIIEDPLANSFVCSPCDSADDHPNVTAEKFTLSEYEDEVLGIADVKVENSDDVAAMNLNAIAEDDGEDATPIQTDKETMQGSGRATDPAKHHSNPLAAMEKKRQQQQQL